MATDFTTSTHNPLIIQGGMGIGVSNWTLARAVSMTGQLGVVSGTAIDMVFVRRLQDGDIGGHVRRAIAQFPLPEVGERAIRHYFLRDGRPQGTPYKMLSMHKQIVSLARQQLIILASFVEVWLAKQGHENPVGINLLTKVQMPNLATLYGAMLAGVDYVLMGAGIPREIPGVLDALAEHRATSTKFDVVGVPSGASQMLTFDPREHFPDAATSLERPRFLAIVSAHSLATTLARKANGRVDGFVIEGPTAGGHNAPPRGELSLNELGEPIYGERDLVDLEKVRELGLPFWLAGGVGSPDGLQTARDAGAAGIQVGTLFAYSDESGFASDIKARVHHPQAIRSKSSKPKDSTRRATVAYACATWAICALRTRWSRDASAIAVPRSRWTPMSQRAATSRTQSDANVSAMVWRRTSGKRSGVTVKQRNRS
jgi:nitronate monooxygenase